MKRLAKILLVSSRPPARLGFGPDDRKIDLRRLGAIDDLARIGHPDVGQVLAARRRPGVSGCVDDGGARR
jgi:hypothetical protein